MRLFHFSEQPDIEIFNPRPVNVASKRKPGFEWLNGPLVWAIDEWHQPMYLFPRECPRILIWPVDTSTSEDVDRYFLGSEARIIAYVERIWMEALRDTLLYRYEFPVQSFKALHDAGMWVSDQRVEPVDKVELTHLDEVLERESVELRSLETLVSLKGLWKTTLHVSGIRLRNAVNWT